MGRQQEVALISSEYKLLQSWITCSFTVNPQEHLWKRLRPFPLSPSIICDVFFLHLLLFFLGSSGHVVVDSGHSAVFPQYKRHYLVFTCDLTAEPLGILPLLPPPPLSPPFHRDPATPADTCAIVLSLHSSQCLCPSDVH